MELNIEEQIIIKGCIDGNPLMQQRLYDEHSKRLMGVCSKYFKNTLDAEEVMQNSFVIVFNKIHKFRGDVPVIYWMRRIAINEALTKIRLKKSKRIFNKKIESLNKHHEYFYEKNTAVNDLNVQDILSVINKLSKSYRTIFNLRAIEGYKHNEIAKMLGINIGTSKSQYARAKNKLAKELAEYR